MPFEKQTEGNGIDAEKNDQQPVRRERSERERERERIGVVVSREDVRGRGRSLS